MCLTPSPARSDISSARTSSSEAGAGVRADAASPPRGRATLDGWAGAVAASRSRMCLAWTWTRRRAPAFRPWACMASIRLPSVPISRSSAALAAAWSRPAMATVTRSRGASTADAMPPSRAAASCALRPSSAVWNAVPAAGGSASRPSSRAARSGGEPNCRMSSAAAAREAWIEKDPSRSADPSGRAAGSDALSRTAWRSMISATARSSRPARRGNAESAMSGTAGSEREPSEGPPRDGASRRARNARSSGARSIASNSAVSLTSTLCSSSPSGVEESGPASDGSAGAGSAANRCCCGGCGVGSSRVAASAAGSWPAIPIGNSASAFSGSAAGASWGRSPPMRSRIRSPTALMRRPAERPGTVPDSEPWPGRRAPFW